VLGEEARRGERAPAQPQPSLPPSSAGGADDTVLTTWAVRCHRLRASEEVLLWAEGGAGWACPARALSPLLGPDAPPPPPPLPPPLALAQGASRVGLAAEAAAAAALLESQPDCEEAAEWRATLPVPRKAFPLSFRFAVAPRAGGGGAPEPVPRAAAAPPHPAAALLLHCGHVAAPDGGWRGAGAAVPVFALRTAHSVGCGDFLDLVPLARLAARAGLRALQLLPVNDTRCAGGWRDSYPYACCSTAALHPLYLRPDALLPAALGRPAELERLLEAARAQPALAPDARCVDYEAALALKLRAARIAFDSEAREGGARAPAGPRRAAFDAFCAQHAAWLRPYAAFRHLAELFGTTEHWRWGCLAGPPSAEALERLCDPQADHAPALLFTCYLQWQLHGQLAAAAAAAAEARVLLKGDLPIGVDKRSVDCWTQPHLFRLATSTGAPPDAFDPAGQNWGFPTYAWQAHAAGGHAWWRRRLALMGRHFTALRVDHILGFFRIWELPAHAVGGIPGRFRPARALLRCELEACGLWDIERLTRPHITGALLAAALGGRAQEVAHRFLLPAAGGEDDEAAARWHFRPEFATEAALCAAPGLQPRAGSPGWLAEELEGTRGALLALLRNVVLLADCEDGNAFHPRWEAERTSSFASLAGWQQQALRQLAGDYFTQRQERVWRAHARATLPALQAAAGGMLLCGEDLGCVPACVPAVLSDLGILGLRIQRMPTAAAGPGARFDSPSAYPHASVCAPSCHDVPSTRAWWQALGADGRAAYAAAFLPRALGGDYARAEAAVLARAAAAAGAAAAAAADASEDVPLSPPPPEAAASAAAAEAAAASAAAAAAAAAAGAAGPPPPERATPALMAAVAELHLASPSALAIFPLADLFSLDEAYCAAVAPEEEAINEPSVKHHYWRYRMHGTLEEWAGNEKWVAGVRRMVEESGRDAK